MTKRPIVNKPTPFLTDPEVTGAIHRALLANRFRKQDLQDGVQEVYLKALRLFQRAAPPPDLERMKALCAKIARDHAIDLLRKADKRRRDFVGRNVEVILRRPIAGESASAVRLDGLTNL